jgi:hypothetical protein
VGQPDGAQCAPPTLLFEAANVIRRHDVAGIASANQAARAHADLRDPEIERVAIRARRLRLSRRA